MTKAATRLNTTPFICRRAKSDMTPCYEKDGDVAVGDRFGSPICVGCDWTLTAIKGPPIVKDPLPKSKRPKTITLTHGDADLIRQWYNNVKDTNPKFLEDPDHELMAKIREVFPL